jgi:hypothetical protein
VGRIPNRGSAMSSPRILVLIVVGSLLLVSCGDDAEDVPEDVAESVDADWARGAQEFRDRVGERFGFTCPQDGFAHTVWGTDTYTDDSSVCTAAVHAGEIDFEQGGTVVIEMQDGQDSYTGSQRNDVTTLDYGQWPGGFTFP